MRIMQSVLSIDVTFYYKMLENVFSRRHTNSVIWLLWQKRSENSSKPSQINKCFAFRIYLTRKRHCYSSAVLVVSVILFELWQIVEMQTATTSQKSMHATSLLFESTFNWVVQHCHCHCSTQNSFIKNSIEHLFCDSLQLMHKANGRMRQCFGRID